MATALLASDIPAIDVHAHYGKYDCGRVDVVNGFMTGDADVVVSRAKQVNVELTIASPLLALLPRGDKNDAVAGNLEAAEICSRTPGIKQYVVIDPRKPETYEQARTMLKQPQCVGIKLHPEEHRYPIVEHGDKLFAFAAEHRAVVLVHSSEQLSLAADFVVFANRYPEMQLILAHLGCGWDGDLTHQVRAIHQSVNGNVYVDTSSARSITPKLIEWGVSEVGVERVLFGTDTPLYMTSMQRARIDTAELTYEQKRMILRENALRLFGAAKLGLPPN